MNEFIKANNINLQLYTNFNSTSFRQFDFSVTFDSHILVEDFYLILIEETQPIFLIVEMEYNWFIYQIDQMSFCI